jgi:hypothetical protein
MSGYGEHRLDLTALPRGFYIITITNEIGSSHSKLIKR